MQQHVIQNYIELKITYSPAYLA